MSNVWASIGAFLLGVGGWWITHFVGRPFRKFFDLRGEVIHKAILYANVTAVQTQFLDGTRKPVEGITDDDIERLREAKDCFRDLAARMRAFALNEPFAKWFVEWRYDPWRASETLLGVSNSLDTYGFRDTPKTELEAALNFRVVERRQKTFFVRLVDWLVGKYPSGWA